MAAIAIRGLFKGFGTARRAAVSDLSLDIADAQITTLLGPEGCGKTTTLRLIAGYIRPDAGTIEVDGRLLSAPDQVVPPPQRDMGMVFANHAVWPHMTVFDNVHFGLRQRRLSAEAAQRKIEDVLALVNLSGLERRYPDELSGDQQYRLALARSLALEPKVLLLDDPLSSLDARLRPALGSDLKALQRRTRITFVYASDDPAEALALSDQVAVLAGGHLLQVGTPHDVYGRPLSRAVAEYMGPINFIAGHVLEIRAGVGRVAAGPDLRLDVTLPEGTRPGDGVEVAVRPENIRLTRLSAPAINGAPARISAAAFLGNVSAFEATLESGLVVKVQTHPMQRFAVGDVVSIEVDVSRCCVFRRESSVDPDAGGGASIQERAAE